MKTLKYFLYLCLISVLVISCDERDFDLPPHLIPQYTGEKANITIAELKALYNSSLAEVDSVLIFEATVVGNDESGNIYRQLIVEDNTGGILLSVAQNGLYATYRVGQKVFVNLKGLWIGKYGNEHQIGTNSDGSIGRMDYEDFQNHVFRDGLPVEVSPTIVKITDLANSSDRYVNTFIRIENVRFQNGGNGIFAPEGSTGHEELIEDRDGNTLVVRSSSYANFASDQLPAGYGIIQGIIGRYNGSWQFTLRSREDLINFGDIEKGSTSANPFNVEEAIAKGKDTENAWWVKGYIVGAVMPGINASNPITGSSNFITSGDFPDNTIVIADSKNETNWEKYIVVNLENLTNNAMKAALNLGDNPGNLGKEVTVAGYLTDYFNANSIKPATGGSGEFVFDSGSTPSGDGSSDNPYAVTQARSNQNNSAAWVKGYIVGIVKNGTTSVTGASDIIFSGKFDSATNVLIADSSEETDYTKCLVVNLPSSTALRSEVNLMDNPSNLGKELKVYGVLRTYFGLPGLRDSEGTNAEFELGGTGTPNPGTGDNILEASFVTGFDNFTAVSVIGDEVWRHETGYGGYVIISGFNNNQNNQNEDWLISPAMNFTNVTSATLTFEHAGKMFDAPFTDLTLWISTNYTSGMPSTATWTQVAIPNYMSGNDWTFVPSGNINLSALAGSANARLAFKYTCTTSLSGTWEIKNVIVK